MDSNFGVQRYFSLDLFGFDTSESICMFLVYEFDCNDRLESRERAGFADESVCALSNGPRDDAKGQANWKRALFDLSLD